MAYEQVVCDVVWRVIVEQLDGSGMNTTARHKLGDFDAERDADQCLADEGFTRQSWGWKRNGAYQHAHVSRVLIELGPMKENI